ncbi:MAG: MFS transporter [Pseudomonadota bacterium]
MNRIRITLAGINFFLADIQGGLGPFLAIFLLAFAGWHPGNIGIILTIAGIVTLVLQTLAGAIVDSSRNKRLILIVSLLAIIIASLAIRFNQSFMTLAVSQCFVGAAGAFFGPVIAAITLGLVGPKLFSKQFSENQFFNHTGNIFGALVTGLFAYYIAINMMFYVVVVLGCMAIVFTSFIKKDMIDDQQARGMLTDEPDEEAASLRVLLANKYLIFLGFSVLLFHLANAAMLTLVGEELATLHQGSASILFIAASIISAQFIMTFMALLVRFKVDKWGRKSIFLIAFLALPIRGFLFTFSTHSYYLLAVQLLDGVGAGIFGAVFPIMIADLTQGTGHYNLALGALTTMQGIGAALSNLIAGFIVVWGGFNYAFTILAIIALMALTLFYFTVPETQPHNVEPFSKNPRYPLE